MPAAVVIIGKKRPDLARGEQRRGVAGDGSACEESASIAWARVMRGIASIAKLVTPGLGQRPVGLGRGQRREVADQDLAASCSRPISSVRRRTATWRTTSAPQAASASPTSAPGLRVLGVGMARALAGAGLDQRPRASRSSLQRFDHVGDQRHAALSLGCLFRDSDLHRVSGAGAYDNAVRRVSPTPASAARRSSVCSCWSALDVDRRDDQPVDAGRRGSARPARRPRPRCRPARWRRRSRRGSPRRRPRARRPGSGDWTSSATSPKPKRWARST